MYKLVHVDDDLFCASFSGASWPTSSNIYIVLDPDGLSLIDVGIDHPECYAALSACIQQAGRRIEDVHTILLTHGHPDHVAGTHAILRSAAARVLIPADSVPEATDRLQQDYYCLPPRTRAIARSLRDYSIIDNFDRTCGSWILDKTRLTEIHHGEEIALGRYAFRAIQTPGHDIGLMCFYESKRRILLTGDLLKSSGPGSALPWYTSTAGGVEGYLKSLDAVANLDVNAAFPAHGRLDGCFGEMVQRTRDVILTRESTILSLLRQGLRTCEQLDVHLYRPVVLELCPWYATVTESHLSKLERAGVVKCDGYEYFIG